MRVDGVLEAHERDQNESLPLVPLESIDQVRNCSSAKINMRVIGVRTKCIRRETSSSGDLNQAITPNEWRATEGNQAGCKLDIFELGAV